MRSSCAAKRMALLLLLLIGCDWPGKPKDTDKPIPAEQIEDFGKLYGMHCAGCHGADGKDGPAPPLNDPLFLAIVPDEVLHRVITEGRTGTPMTAFAKDTGGPLTDKQIHILAHGIQQHWKPDKPEHKTLPYLLSDAKAGDKKKGLEVFARDCAMCHGEQGQGGDDAGAIHDTAFLTLVSNQVLRRYIITGRPDFGMPHYADPKRGDAGLTSQEINDLVALLAYWRVGGSVNGK